ncbi:hypothetical protein HZH66_000376 [Vespula vulgaris]|uniref:Uncharacterized protein n=1 Tax=Vespula vulgaris TaxID=7454 RepID=A0A834NIK3_VESVU|nr:hypothetical protein HZH66_000376 [Vespula vulgaris]
MSLTISVSFLTVDRHVVDTSFLLLNRTGRRTGNSSVRHNAEHPRQVQSRSKAADQCWEGIPEGTSRETLFQGRRVESAGLMEESRTNVNSHGTYVSSFRPVVSSFNIKISLKGQENCFLSTMESENPVEQEFRESFIPIAV